LKRLHLLNLGAAGTLLLVVASLGTGIACYYAMERPLTSWVNTLFGRSPAAVTSQPS
jgi:hypothetical protein